MTSALEHERSSKLFVIAQWSWNTVSYAYCSVFTSTPWHILFSASYSNGKTTEWNKCAVNIALNATDDNELG